MFRGKALDLAKTALHYMAKKRFPALDYLPDCRLPDCLADWLTDYLADYLPDYLTAWLTG